MEGCSVTFFVNSERSLRRQYGERFLDSQGQLNELIKVLGEAERIWQALPTTAGEKKPCAEK